MNRKKEIIILLIIVFLAMVVRFILSLPSGVAPDSVFYMSLSERIADGFLSLEFANKLHEFLQPGYPILIYFFNLFFRNPEISGIFVSMLCGLLLIPMIYYLNKRLFNERVALLASFLVAFSPLMIRYSQYVLTESVFTFIFLATVYLLWILLNKKKNVYLFLFLGILIGISYYVRIVGLISLGVTIFWLFIYWLSKRMSFKKFILSTFTVILGVVIIITPYVAYLYNQKGQFVVTGMQDYSIMALEELGPYELDEYREKHKYFNGLTEDNTDYKINRLEENLDYRKREQSLFANYADQFTTYIGSHFGFIFNRYIIHILLIIVAFIVYKRKKKNTQKLSYLISWIPFFLIIYLVGEPKIRYYIPLMPLILSLSSVGAIFLIDKFKSKFKISYIIIITVLILFNLLSYSFDYGKDYEIFGIFKDSEEISQEKKMGEYIKNNYGEERKMLVTRPRIAYYAGGEYYVIPMDDYESVIYFSKYNKIDFLILDKIIDPAARPDMTPIFEISENEDISLIYHLNNLYLYKIKYGES